MEKQRCGALVAIRILSVTVTGCSISLVRTFCIPDDVIFPRTIVVGRKKRKQRCTDGRKGIVAVFILRNIRNTVAAAVVVVAIVLI